MISTLSESFRRIWEMRTEDPLDENPMAEALALCWAYRHFGDDVAIFGNQVKEITIENLEGHHRGLTPMADFNREFNLLPDWQKELLVAFWSSYCLGRPLVADLVGYTTKDIEQVPATRITPYFTNHRDSNGWLWDSCSRDYLLAKGIDPEGEEYFDIPEDIIASVEFHFDLSGIPEEILDEMEAYAKALGHDTILAYHNGLISSF